ncbi:hypothetical protein C8F01DRAFT_1117678 [Mycena amicta]|nr:hypothetical protein C8F01DRAFT_1117678 [Mycena amicta]
MGLTGLARWVNAPAEGLKLVQENIALNHNGHYKGPWNLSVSLYRSALGQGLAERTIFALTMEKNVFVLVEDPAAPNRADVVESGQEALYLQRHHHYRHTFLTVRPNGGLEQLIAQLGARWKPVREVQRGQPIPHLSIEGAVYGIGNDWIVRVGNVVLPGGSAIKGMLLEAEYLPLPVLQSGAGDGSSELLSNLLTSILPMVTDAKTVAVTISDTQWQDVLWDGEDKPDTPPVEENEDDIYAWGDAVPQGRHDWLGINRDRRSAFLILGGLRSESLLG